MTVAEHLRAATARLAPMSDTARLDAELLVAHALRRSRAALLARGDETVEIGNAGEIETLIARRERGEPVSYLLGTQGFWTLELDVTPDVLIPRPETETLVEWALAWAPAAARILDLGTGSGCIALALACERKDATVVATDRSAAALDVARANAARHGVKNLQFLAGSWFDAVNGVQAPFDLIVSNPPYIAERDPHLAQLRFEPRDALIAGTDGLDDLRLIVSQAGKWLRAGGGLLVEHGYDQGAPVRALFEAAGFMHIRTRADLGGRERVTGGRRS
jgi:release factor glutamine methyltransferase